jgi:fructose-1,6-bisphosphatase/inositol monophosphatase family enzyme
MRIISICLHYGDQTITAPNIHIAKLAPALLIAQEAGCTICDTQGGSLNYNPKQFKTKSYIISNKDIADTLTMFTVAQ